MDAQNTEMAVLDALRGLWPWIPAASMEPNSDTEFGQDSICWGMEPEPTQGQQNQEVARLGAPHWWLAREYREVGRVMENILIIY